jgi:hypothetical protein
MARKAWIKLLGSIGAGILLIWIVWTTACSVAAWQVRGMTTLPETDRARHESEGRLAYVQVVGGIVLLFGVIFTWRRTRAAEKDNEIENIRITSEREDRNREHRTGQWDRAIGHLNTNSEATIIGASTILTSLGREPMEYESVLEFLSAYLRHYQHWEFRKPPAPFPIDKLALIRVLDRVRRMHGRETKIDLSEVDYRNADLRRISLPNSVFWRSLFTEYLAGSNFYKTGAAGGGLSNPAAA